jgi:very-short-patch-repair endonuclease
LTRQQRRKGGLQRSRQPSFIELQRRRGRKGAQVVLDRYGPKALAETLAEYYRNNPSSLEIFVQRVLTAAEVAFERERVVEVVPDQVYWRIDFVLAGQGPGGADLVIEPGAAHWHDPERDAARVATLTRLGYPFILLLNDTEIEQTPDMACRRILAFLINPTQVEAPFGCCLERLAG